MVYIYDSNARMKIITQDLNGGQIRIEIGRTTVHFYQGLCECPLYITRNPSLTYMDGNGKRRRKSLAQFLRTLSQEQLVDFPENFKVRIRRMKNRRTVGDHSQYETHYRGVSLNCMLA